MSTWKARKDYPTRVPRVQVSQVETWTRYIEEDPGVLEWFLQPLSEGVNWKEIRARGDTDTKALYGWAWDCLVEAAESAYQLGRDQKVDGARGGGNSAWYRANQEWEDLGKSDKCPVGILVPITSNFGCRQPGEEGPCKSPILGRE